MALLETIISIISKPYQLWKNLKNQEQCDRKVAKYLIILDEAVEHFVSLVTKTSSNKITILGDVNPEYAEKMFFTKKKINNLTKLLEKKIPNCSRQMKKEIYAAMMRHKITLQMYQNY